MPARDKNPVIGIDASRMVGHIRTGTENYSDSIIRALLDQPAMVHHDDAVRMLDGREPVRHDERGAPLHQAGQAGLHERLALGVQADGALTIEQHELAFTGGRRAVPLRGAV